MTFALICFGLSIVAAFYYAAEVGASKRAARPVQGWKRTDAPTLRGAAKTDFDTFRD